MLPLAFRLRAVCRPSSFPVVRPATRCFVANLTDIQLSAPQQVARMFTTKMSDQDVINMLFNGVDPRKQGTMREEDWELLKDDDGSFTTLAQTLQMDTESDSDMDQYTLNKAQLDQLEPESLRRSNRLLMTDAPPEVKGKGRFIKDPFMTDDEEGYPAGVMGIDSREMTEALMDEIARPIDWEESSARKTDEDANEFDQLGFTVEEAKLNKRRDELKQLVEDPMPIPNRPLWPLSSTILRVDQVQNITAKGMVPSVKILTLVGNHRGSAGFGIGKHKDAAMAARFAMRNAQRDMIAVHTHNGQLYHDLIGKKNGTTVLIRSVPPRTRGNAGGVAGEILELFGLKNCTVKVLGSKRKNPYSVVQAVFDAFNNHVPPEDVAFDRGMRMVWMGKNRHNPNNFYPTYPKGPRHTPVRFKK